MRCAQPDSCPPPLYVDRFLSDVAEVEGAIGSDHTYEVRVRVRVRVANPNHVAGG
jgi:hypothetical protein